MPRPKLKIKSTPTDYLIEVVSAVAVAGLIFLPFYYYGQLPDTIPHHFNEMGEADKFGSKNIIWLFPIIGLILYIAMSALSRFPHRFNYPVKITEENAYYQYKNAIKLGRTIKLFSVLVLLFITYKSITYGLGDETGLTIYFLPLFLGLIFGTLAIYVFSAIKNKRIDDHLR